MYWWGGYGVSTEHTAYLNLKKGIKAPESGSIKQNGKVLAEQIGGQIFIDTWGLICPGEPKRAARYAVSAASVSHDGEGLNGAAFISACIAEAFITNDIHKIIEKGLEQIANDSLYAQVVKDVIKFYETYPQNWRDCREMLEENWGYDRFPGVCHIIPNAGVCALSMLYGEGDFSRTIEIATMCSWDTDCNAGNVGTILGVANGLDNIPNYYRAPIEDEVVLSGISGYLNVLDIPSYCKYLAGWAYFLKKQHVPKSCQFYNNGEIFFDFTLPGSTHSIKYSGTNTMSFRRSRDFNAVEVLLNKVTRGEEGKIFYRTLWRRADFDDERYMPVFSPTAYSGQHVEIKVTYEKHHGEAIQVTPYVVSAIKNKEIHLLPLLWKKDIKNHIFAFTIPDLHGDMVREIGLKIESASPAKFFDAGRVIVSSFRIFGPALYKLRVDWLPKEFNSILGFSHNHGAWNIEDGMIHCLSNGHAESMTGNYFTKDAIVTGILCPENGGSHLISIHVQGAQRGYYGGLAPNNEAVLLKNEHGKLRTLASCNFNWKFDQQYKVSLEHIKGKLTLSIDDKPILSKIENEFNYGMIGYAIYGIGRCKFGDLFLEEIEGEIKHD